MKFRVKVTVCMICLMTLLFSFGSCALISCSFQASLDREQAVSSPGSAPRNSLTPWRRSSPNRGAVGLGCC